MTRSAGTSSERGSRRRLANLLLPETDRRDVAPASSGLRRLRETWGRRRAEIWLGTRFEVRSEHLWFGVSRADRALLRGVPGEMMLALHDVTAVETEPGVVTGIVAVHHERGVLRFRCWRADRVAAEVAAAARATR
ncbi:hypothetical protein V5D56_07470 [Cellulosimicrobium sp. PMB13]|uniref:hypothetical protein n=1 Tax=Cellulosimicrobium sp. PMB13 TaxID=3120158 RepID=UPI003F4C8B90